MSETFLRPAALGDLPRVTQVAEQAGLRVDGPHLLGTADAQLWVLVTSGNEVRGFVASREVAGEVEIEDIAICAPHRNRGLGRRLLEGYLCHLEQRGVGRVLLEVAADNVAALALYRNAGFASVGRRPRYYSTGQDAVLMDCCLPRPK